MTDERPWHKQPRQRTPPWIRYLNLICKKRSAGTRPCGYVCVYLLISRRKMRRRPLRWQVMHFTFNKLTLQCVRTYKQGVSSREINGLWGGAWRLPRLSCLATGTLDAANPCLISRHTRGAEVEEHKNTATSDFQFGTNKKLNSNVILIRKCCWQSGDLWLRVWWCFPTGLWRVCVDVCVHMCVYITSGSFVDRFPPTERGLSLMP